MFEKSKTNQIIINFQKSSPKINSFFLYIFWQNIYHNIVRATYNDNSKIPVPSCRLPLLAKKTNVIHTLQFCCSDAQAFIQGIGSTWYIVIIGTTSGPPIEFLTLVFFMTDWWAGDSVLQTHIGAAPITLLSSASKSSWKGTSFSDYGLQIILLARL